MYIHSTFGRIIALALALALAGCAQLRKRHVGPDLALPADLATPPAADLTVAAADLAHTPMTHIVKVAPNGSLLFVPDSVTIQAGDTVRWEFDSTHHSVTGVDGTWCSPNDQDCSAGTPSSAGDVYTHTFPRAGSFPYFCTPHLTDGMEGTVLVQ